MKILGDFYRLRLKLLLSFGLAALFSRCGATLPREISVNGNPAKGEGIDFEKLFFVSLETGERIQFSTYMESQKLEFVLLNFGSKDCQACLDKAEYLETNLVKSEAFLDQPGFKNFALIGVAVDGERHRAAVQLRTSELSHFKWMDPNAKQMMASFQPAGMPLSVPLSVMISRKNGVLWKIPSNVKTSAADLLRRVASTLGENIQGELPPDPAGSTAPGPTFDERLLKLAKETPERLDDIVVQPLRGWTLTDTRLTELTLKDVFGTSKFKMVQVGFDDCETGSICDRNRTLMEEFRQSAMADFQEATLINPSAKRKDNSASSNVFLNSDEFVQVFPDHFEWQRPWTPENISPRGPWLMIFDDIGRIVFSHQGRLEESQLSDSWQTTQWKSRAEGPKHQLYGKDGFTDFSVLRQNSKWTVVLFYGRSCGACKDELKHWHEENQLIDMCRARPEFCQVLALENGEDWDQERSSVPDYYQEIFADFNLNQWNLDLILDPNAYGVSDRWFEEWATPRFGPGYRSVMFDREGKAWASWPSAPGETGPKEFLNSTDP
jgi:hypothetical protein